ncbi:MAG: glucosamine-6-phosphate deaminase [Lacunisphaera sp.]|nr:glucosamine-6-phosphate deaminase [Lacunisphaera sp.]
MIPHFTEARQRERVPTEISASAEGACVRLADEIATLIRANDAAGRPTVFGLATGSTPVPLYRQLIRLHRDQGLSFRHVITFNLDEYHGLPRTHPESYWCFMHEQLFNHVDVPPAHINIPDGMVPRDQVYEWCRTYEEKIKAAGGLDLQILGIGRTGHIGFNEPGSGSDSRTRLVTLDALTRRDAARDFLGEANVPRHAITMGVGTILEARRIVLLAWGEAKAGALAGAVENPPTEALPASFLQTHPDTVFYVDAAAAGELTRLRHPWLVGPVAWSRPMTRLAVVWLSQQARKPILKLLDEDYSEHSLADLLTEQGPAYGLNIRIFNELQHTITGWPGGKPNADDTNRPERATPESKRIVVFSPEPSNDVLGMGGTLRRLVSQGHQVTVAYMTSGNLGVPDEEAAMAAELVLEFDLSAGGAGSPGAVFAREVRQQLQGKTAYAADSTEVRKLKAIIRRNEARASLQACGVDTARVRFLELSFYEKGRYRRFKPTPDDVSRIVTLLEEIQPHQIFGTGQIAEPSSVPALCFSLLRQALDACQTSPWRKDCHVWLYREPDRMWEPAEIAMAVPLSPRELTQKIQAIYQHKSQRSQSPMLAQGLHELWQQAEHHNQAIAKLYDALGLAEYEAIEAFQPMVSIQG